MSLVGLTRFDEHSTPLQEAIEKSFDLIHFQFSQKVQKIAIKPNLCYYWDYSTGETTDPKFVSSLIDVIRDHAYPDVEISIVESDASAMRCKYAFRMLGYEQMAEEKNVELVNLTNDQAKKVNVNIRHRNHQFSVPKTIADADMLINVPKIKYMQQVKISCALKNMYGCNPHHEKFKYHKWIDEAIVGLNKIMRPRLCLVDGIIVKGIETLKLGLIMASTDPVAVDAAASTIAGINPYSIKHVVLASEEKIGNMNFITKGEPLDCFKNLFPRKNAKYKTREFLSRVYGRFFT